MSTKNKEIPISMDEQNIIDLSNKKNNKNYNRLLYDIGILIKNSDSMTKARYYNNTTNVGWFDSLTKLSIIDTYDSVIGKKRSLSILQTQIENIDNKFKETWNELVFFSTTKEQYQELSSSIIKKDLSNCKKIIKDSCKIGEKFQYQNKEYEVTQSGILAGIYLIDKIKILEVKEYLLRGTTFSQVENFKGYMAKFEKYNLEILFGKFIADLVPINKGNYESTFENNPNRILDKNSKKTISNKITIKSYKSNYYSLNLPNYINKNGKEKNIDDTSSIEDYTIDDILPQGNVVCDGAILSCSGSTGGTSTLKIFPEINIFMNEKPIGVISNSKANINILSFGMCKLTSNPAVARNKNNPVSCMPSSVSPWKDGVSYFLAGNEKAISDKSTCQCSYGGTISIDPNQVGQTFLGYSNGSGNSESGKDNENEKEEKNDGKKEKSQILKGQENETVDERVEIIEFLIKKGDTGEIVREINIRLMGFGGGLPSEEYNDYTVKVVKQFKTDYMKQSNADGTFVDMATIEAIDKFAEEYPITEAEFNQMKCICKKCKVFGSMEIPFKLKTGLYKKYKKDKNGKKIKDKDGKYEYEIKKYNYTEYPGIHKAVLWILNSFKFYLKDNNQYVSLISSGYRCSINNTNNDMRGTTNHMGNALDIHISNIGGKRITDTIAVNNIREEVFVKQCGAVLGWEANKIGLERVSDGATDWIHFDVRELDKEEFMKDTFYIFDRNEILKPKKLKSLAGSN